MANKDNHVTKYEQAVFLTPVQVFINTKKRIQYYNGWGVGGRNASEVADFDTEATIRNQIMVDGTDKIMPSFETGVEFLIPLLPDNLFFDLFVNKRQQLKLEDTFLDRQNSSFNLYTSLAGFLEQISRIDITGNLLADLQQIRENVYGARLGPRVHYGERFERHYYLAPDEAENPLIMEFDDDMYRPTIYRAKFGEKSGVKYRNIRQSIQKWAQLDSAEVEEIFYGVNDSTINAMNDGLRSFRQIEQETFAPTTNNNVRVDEVDSMPGTSVQRAVEVVFAPTVWLDTTKQRVLLSYDFFADWHETESGKVYADLGAFRAWHVPQRHQLGLIQKRQRRQIQKKEVRQ